MLKKLIQKVDSCSVEVKFHDKTEEIVIDDPYEGSKDTMPLYLSEEPVRGKVILRPAKKVQHQGIRLELVGQIVVTNDREERTEFTAQCKKYEAEGGDLLTDKELEFEFDCPKQYESYRGLNARVAYYVRTTVIKSMKNISHKQEVWVHRHETKHKVHADNLDKKSYFKETDFTKGVCMEVGVDDILHIEFKYDKKM
eukprot:NODE_1187_length_1248_cov_80.686405_g965_i0.p1 GENE.NODE_1187_length_1248_cov_80.686405_g965_i0~~NODE_1187_length_1248_cov_80.686405_g965_i0.p1  ORF type:complete len:197 (-),score=47.54 NODE_1187_length_1248_cov_80.686405_g965_i0:577-1167(-)